MAAQRVCQKVGENAGEKVDPKAARLVALMGAALVVRWVVAMVG